MVQKKSDKPNLQTLPVAQTAAASAFPMLPTLGVGTLDSYIAYVNRVPILSAAEELHLAQEFRRTENVDAAKTLVLSHLRLVVSESANIRIFRLSASSASVNIHLPFSSTITSGGSSKSRDILQYSGFPSPRHPSLRLNPSLSTMTI